MTGSSDVRGAPGVLRCPNCGKKNRVPAVANGAPRCGNCKAPLPWIVDAGDDSFSAVADESSLPVIVDLWAPWCGPCRAVSPVLEQLATDMAGRIKLVKVNADVAPQVSRRFEAKAIPTLVLLDHGQVVDAQIGALPAPQLRQWLESKLSARAR
jgi:thioredoxin 2